MPSAKISQKFLPNQYIKLKLKPLLKQTVLYWKLKQVNKNLQFMWKWKQCRTTETFIVDSRMQKTAPHAPGTVAAHEKPTDWSDKRLLASRVFDLAILAVIILHKQFYITTILRAVATKLVAPSKHLSESPSHHHVPTEMLYLLCTQTDFILCTGLQLQSTVLLCKTQSASFKPCSPQIA